VPDGEWPSEADQRQTIFDDFGPRWGDRRQEIVFIGVHMDEVGGGRRGDSSVPAAGQAGWLHPSGSEARSWGRPGP